MEDQEIQRRNQQLKDNSETSKQLLHTLGMVSTISMTLRDTQLHYHNQVCVCMRIKGGVYTFSTIGLNCLFSVPELMFVVQGQRGLAFSISNIY